MRSTGQKKGYWEAPGGGEEEECSRHRKQRPEGQMGKRAGAPGKVGWLEKPQGEGEISWNRS